MGHDQAMRSTDPWRTRARISLYPLPALAPVTPSTAHFTRWMTPDLLDTAERNQAGAGQLQRNTTKTQAILKAKSSSFFRWTPSSPQAQLHMKAQAQSL